MSLATHSGQLFQVTIVPLDNCSSQNLFLRSFTNGHLQRGRSLEWTIEYLPQLLQSLISLTDDNRKNKDQNSNKRFALFTLSSYYESHVCPQKTRKPGSYYLKDMMLITPCPYLEFLPEVSSSAATNQANGGLNWVWSARNFLYISRLIYNLTHLQANTHYSTE